MSHLFFCVLLCLVFAALPDAVSAQKKWSGEAGDGRWDNPLNWSDNTIPLSSDDVVLDNSIVADNYMVQLPDLAVSVKTILIDPSSGRNIELALPASNTAVPALVVAGPGYGLTINNGGIFRNASGASSGVPMNIADSIRINNGGRYIHNSPASHAANVQVLSAAPGTETGIMEFDIPDASSTLSISNRVYGKLELRAMSAGGTTNYTAAGTNRVVVRSDLVIGEGVKFNLNFSDTLFIGGSLLQGGVFNLGNTARTMVVDVKGDVVQSASGIITETGTSLPSVVFSGDGLQRIDIKGFVTNDVSVVKNGKGNILLENDLFISHRLSLMQGKIITSSGQLLILAASCTVEADSLLGNSFIDGPVKKEGLNKASFLFPVGKGNRMRWVELRDATGDFTVEYHQSDPNIVSNLMGTGLDHISHIEYWNIFSENDANGSVAKLSFYDPHSGGVTRMEDLRVARLVSGVWQDAGNTGFEGMPGSNGWVSSFAASGFSAENNFFALASAIGQENPLPFFDISLKVKEKSGKILFEWVIPPDLPVHEFELQESADNFHFTTIYTTPSADKKIRYEYQGTPEMIDKQYYRLLARDKDALNVHYSKIVPLFSGNKRSYLRANSIVRSILSFSIFSAKRESINCSIYNMQGTLVKRCIFSLTNGVNHLSIPVNELAGGVYIIRFTSRSDTFKFIKL